MVDASKLAKAIKHPFRNILERRNQLQLVMAISMPMFQILTGINLILFYAPVIFESLGFCANTSLYSSVLIGVVLVLSTLVSIATIERWGHRPLLLGGGIQMIVCQVRAKLREGRPFFKFLQILLHLVFKHVIIHTSSCLSVGEV